MDGLALWRTAMGLDPCECFEKRHLLSLGLPLLKIWIEAEKLRIKEAALAKLNAENQSPEAREQEAAKNAEELRVEELAEEESTDENDFVWTAELVADACPKILRRATRHFLRLKWWKRISASTIDFKPALSPSKSKNGPAQSRPSRHLSPQSDAFECLDPRRIKLLLHELRRAEAKGGSWQVVAPWPMAVPFWV